MAGVTVAKGHCSTEMGMHTEGLGGRTQQRFFDIADTKTSGSVIPMRPTSTSTSAPSSIASCSARRQMLKPPPDQRRRHHRSPQSGFEHSVAVGILNRLRLHIEGSCGYFALGLLDGSECSCHRPRRLGLRRDTLAGTIVIEKDAGSQFGAALRGGDLVCKGSVGARTGIDQGRYDHRRRRWARSPAS